MFSQKEINGIKRGYLCPAVGYVLRRDVLLKKTIRFYKDRKTTAHNLCGCNCSSSIEMIYPKGCQLGACVPPGVLRKIVGVRANGWAEMEHAPGHGGSTSPGMFLYFTSYPGEGEGRARCCQPHAAHGNTCPPPTPACSPDWPLPPYSRAARV